MHILLLYILHFMKYIYLLIYLHMYFDYEGTNFNEISYRYIDRNIIYTWVYAHIHMHQRRITEYPATAQSYRLLHAYS